MVTRHCLWIPSPVISTNRNYVVPYGMKVSAATHRRQASLILKEVVEGQVYPVDHKREDPYANKTVGLLVDKWGIATQDSLTSALWGCLSLASTLSLPIDRTSVVIDNPSLSRCYIVNFWREVTGSCGLYLHEYQGGYWYKDNQVHWLSINKLIVGVIVISEHNRVFEVYTNLVGGVEWLLEKFIEGRGWSGNLPVFIAERLPVSKRQGYFDFNKGQADIRFARSYLVKQVS